MDKRYDRGSQYSAYSDIIVENERALAEYLRALPNADKEQQLFEELMEIQRKVSYFEELNRFIEGFHLGAQFVHSTFVLPGQSVIRDLC